MAMEDTLFIGDFPIESPSLPCLMTPEGNIDAVFMVDVANVVDVCAKDPSSLVR